MVLCLFVDCHARSRRDKDVPFFSVPSIITNHGEEAKERSIERRMQWIAAISRDDLTKQILKNDRVCSRHFVSGQPAKDYDKFNVDWVPTLNLGHSKRKKKDGSTADQDRVERAKARWKKLNETKVEIEEKKLRLNDEGTQASKISFAPFSGDMGLLAEESQEREEIDVSFAEQNIPENEKSCQTKVNSFGKMCTKTDFLCRKFYDASSQTEEFDYLFASNKKVIEFDEEYFRNSDDKVLFYSCLPSYHILNFVFELMSPSVSRHSQSLSPFQEFVMVLIKLKLDVPFQDLAYRFNISVPTVSRTFHSWLMTVDIRLSPFVHWPDR